MRDEKKLKNALKKCGADNKSDIFGELKSRYPQYVGKTVPTRTQNRKSLYTVISAAAACAACIAIAVPCAVMLRNNEDVPNGSGDRHYFIQGQYTDDFFDYTIKEYNEINDSNILYFDWYDIAEEYNTYSYTDNESGAVLCLEEMFFLVETEEMVTMYVTKCNVYLSLFDYRLEICSQNEQTVEGVTVNWIARDIDTIGIFEYGDYRYFIEIDIGNSQDRLFELVNELIE